MVINYHQGESLYVVRYRSGIYDPFFRGCIESMTPTITFSLDKLHTAEWPHFRWNDSKYLVLWSLPRIRQIPIIPIFPIRFPIFLIIRWFRFFSDSSDFFDESDFIWKIWIIRIIRKIGIIGKIRESESSEKLENWNYPKSDRKNQNYRNLHDSRYVWVL